MTALGPMTTLGPILQPSPIVAVGSYTNATRGIKERESLFLTSSVVVSRVILAHTKLPLNCMTPENNSLLR